MEKALKALGNRRRLKILKILKRKRISVTELAEEMKLSFRATSRHLLVLYSGGFLEKEQKSLVVFYKYKTSRIKELSQAITAI